MVFLWAWKVHGWRWLVHKQQNVPKFVSASVLMAVLYNIGKLGRTELYQLEGFSDSYESRLAVAGNKILDDKKIVTLASRKWIMKKNLEAAQEYFAQHGHTPRPTNKHLILNDSLGY